MDDGVNHHAGAPNVIKPSIQPSIPLHPRLRTRDYLFHEPSRKQVALDYCISNRDMGVKRGSPFALQPFDICNNCKVKCNTLRQQKTESGQFDRFDAMSLPGVKQPSEAFT